MIILLSKIRRLILLACLFVGMLVLSACLPAPVTVISQEQTQAATIIPTFTSTIASTITSTITSTIIPSPTPTFTATTENVCPGGNCAYTCLSKLKSFLNGNGQPLSPPSSIYPHPGRSLKMVPLVTYQIEGDQIYSPVLAPNLSSDLLPYQSDSPAQQRIWNYVAKILPSDQRREIKTFVIATDGTSGVLASISLLTADLSSWQLNVDIVDAVDPTDMTYTLLHEFGHLLTLDNSQETPDLQLLNHPDDQQVYAAEASTCPQFLTSEGCSKPDSYINEFYQKFWIELFPPWAKINAETDPATYERQLGEFYFAHQDQFVTPYSVTNPEEDIAESWVHFIFDKKPTGTSIAQQKLLFFYGYPDLVSLRNQIVNNICLYSAGK